MVECGVVTRDEEDPLLKASFMLDRDKDYCINEILGKKQAEG